MSEWWKLHSEKTFRWGLLLVLSLVAYLTYQGNLITNENNRILKERNAIFVTLMEQVKGARTDHERILEACGE